MTKKKDDAKPLDRKGLVLKPDEESILRTYLKEGFVPTLRRRTPVQMPLSDEKIVELGEQAAKLDGDLRVMRQGKNATSAALQREKKEREGAMHQMSALLVTKKDALGKALTIAERAAYTRQHAQIRKEYDEFEASRKETIAGLKEQLDEAEAAHTALSERIATGMGSEMVSVIDLTDYMSSTVISIRCDNGQETDRRALKDHERQVPLFEEISNAPAMTDTEYALCVAGRIGEAGRSYAARNKLTEAKARQLLQAILPSEADADDPDLLTKNGGEETPPEKGDDTDTDSDGE